MNLLENSSSSAMNITGEYQGSLHTFAKRNRSGLLIFCRPISEVYVLVAVYSILIFFIVVTNSIIIFTFAKNKKIRTVTNYFFASLAVSDILVGCVSIPMWVYMFVFPLNNNCGLPGKSFMAVYRFMDIFSALSSTAHLIAISFERSLAITRPIRHRTCPKNFFYGLLVIAWLYGLLTSILIVSDISEIWQRYRAIAVFVAGFFFPFLTIIILYTMTYRSVKSYVKRRLSNSPGNLHKYVHRERKTAITVVFVLAIFILAWLPFFVVSLVVTFCISCRQAIQGFTPVVNFVKILHYMNSAINPFIYTFRNCIWKAIFLRAVLPCVKFEDKRKQVQLNSQGKSSDIRNRSRNEYSHRNSPDTELKNISENSGLLKKSNNGSFIEKKNQHSSI